ncbi:MAG TPA: T9SS type A sorting domain-containing protein [Chitinophagaceae bacterium]|nr:T9SS type A sorting domain-containing protein [Chitinophagaceae bacterium]
MRTFSKYIISAKLFLYTIAATAQPGFYVPKSAKIFFNGDTATIFSNVINNGNLGVGKNAFVNFSGTTWENDPLSLITDESLSGNGVTGTGGWIRFLSDSIRQVLKGGYSAAIKSGPLFSHLQIQNKNGVYLDESSTKVRKEIRFSLGRMYLSDYMITIGENNPGVISGYDSLRYFVTGNKPGSGYLIRENITNNNGRVDFPVGSRDDSYTPAAIQSNTSTGDDYYVNVFDSVKTGRLTGINLLPQSVNKTWEIGKRQRPGLGDAEIFLQHLNRDEGSQFKLNRNNAYVAYYNGNAWDTGAPQSTPVTGFITSGSILSGSGVNSRIFYNTIAAPSYFTKLTGDGTAALRTYLWFNARRTGYSTVLAYWYTKPEVSVRYFVLERMLSNENNFKQVDTVLSQVNGAVHLSELDYSSIDSNSYTGISFYRLKVVNLDTSYFYSNIIAVGGIPGRGLNLLWPNPTQDVFWVSCDPVWKIESIVVWNALGQKIRQVATNGRNVIQLDALPTTGTYFVSFVREGGQIVETKKLVVVGH